MRRLLRTVCILGLVFGLACESKPANTKAATDGGAKTQGPKAVKEALELASYTGEVIEKPWTKSAESWNAGGSEYYVLKVKDGALPAGRKNAKEGVILRPSKEVTMADFKKLKGKNVRVSGEFTEGEVVEDKPSEGPVLEQRPSSTGPDGKPVKTMRGSGFIVKKIEELK